MTKLIACFRSLRAKAGDSDRGLGVFPIMAERFSTERRVQNHQGKNEVAE